MLTFQFQKMSFIIVCILMIHRKGNFGKLRLKFHQLQQFISNKLHIFIRWYSKENISSTSLSGKTSAPDLFKEFFRTTQATLYQKSFLNSKSKVTNLRFCQDTRKQKTYFLIANKVLTFGGIDKVRIFVNISFSINV